jgi:hypothetical protein
MATATSYTQVTPGRQSKSATRPGKRDFVPDSAVPESEVGLQPEQASLPPVATKTKIRRNAEKLDALRWHALTPDVAPAAMGTLSS